MPSLPPAIDLAVHRQGSGPSIVVLHDLGRSGTHMLDALGELASEFRIVAPDLRGHGDSPTPPGPWSVDDFASDVARLIAEEGGPLPVVGVGLGASAALALSLGHPGTASGLVLSGEGPRGEDAAGRDRWTRAARAVRESGGPEGVALAAEAMGNRPDWRGALIQVTEPVLIVAGEADRTVPIERQRELSHWIHGARFRSLPGTGHDLASERPAALAAAVRRLVSVPAAAPMAAAA